MCACVVCVSGVCWVCVCLRACGCGCVGCVCGRVGLGVGVCVVCGWSAAVGSAEESGPVRAGESGPVRADEFADEDMVQEAEELRHVLPPVLPSGAEVEAHNVSHLPFRSWCSACAFEAEDFRSVIAELMRKQRRQNRSRQFRWTTGSSGNQKVEHMTRSQCSLCEIAKVKAFGSYNRSWTSRDGNQMETLINLGAAQVAKTTSDAHDFQTSCTS